MEIEEVKVVWIKVIPSIREVIDVDELTSYVADFFATSSLQKIKAQKSQSGGIFAADHFFEEAQRKPKSFPVILAALKRTNQPDVLIEILKTVIKEIKVERHDAIFGLVRQAGRKLRYPVDVEDEIREAQGPTLYNRHQHRTEVSNIADGAEVNNLEAGKNSHNNQRSHNPQTDQSQQVQPASPDSNSPEVVPNTRPSAVPPHSQVIYQRRQLLGQIRDTPDVKLRVMKACARTKISVKLEAPSPDEDTPIWSLLLDSEDLDISAEESSEIEKSTKPGKDFYDKLAQRDYTTGKLIEMLERHHCQDAAKTVREQSLNIVTPSPGQENLRCNENNLDVGLQASPNEQEPQFNISSDIQNTERVLPDRSRSVQGGNQLPLNLGLSGSLDDNIRVPAEIGNSNTWNSKEDEGKGTQAITAVGDPGNLRSQLPPEGERTKLLSDRVGQHASDQGNLDSFRDIGKPSEQNKNIQTGDQPRSHDFSSVGALQQPGLFQPQQQQVPSNTETQSEIGSQSEETCEKESHIVNTSNYGEHVDSYQKLHRNMSSSIGLSMSPLTVADTDEPDRVGQEGRNEEEKETNN